MAGMYSRRCRSHNTNKRINLFAIRRNKIPSEHNLLNPRYNNRWPAYSSLISMKKYIYSMSDIVNLNLFENIIMYPRFAEKEYCHPTSNSKLRQYLILCSNGLKIRVPFTCCNLIGII
jgi:hypothetical protein